MLRIRALTIHDVPLLAEMIVEFARFERLEEYVKVNKETLGRDGFGAQPRFRALLAEWEGKVAGYALHFPFYSSFEGPGLFLEDVYVREEFRGKGIGKALMAEVAATAVREQLLVMRWEVLNWNQSAIDFYAKLGGEILEEWKAVRLEGEALARLAEGARR